MEWARQHIGNEGFSARVPEKLIGRLAKTNTAAALHRTVVATLTRHLRAPDRSHVSCRPAPCRRLRSGQLVLPELKRPGVLTGAQARGNSVKFTGESRA
jgi:hypothetical protein